MHHRNEPERALWSTPRHSCFVSAAVGESTIHESHGSYSLHDEVELLFTHQTVEEIAITTKSSNASPSHCKTATGSSICLGSGEVRETPAEVDPDGTVVSGDGDGDVVVSGCLYTTWKLARDELRHFHEGRLGRENGSPFHDEVGARSDERVDASSWFGRGDGVRRVGVRYRLVFSERRENQLGFHVEVDLPVRKRDDVASFVPRSMQWSKSELSSSRAIKGRQWRYGGGGRGWSGAHPLSRAVSTSEEDFEVVNVPRLNRVLITYASHARERFFGFGEQFSSFDLKGRRVPIMVQEQGLGRGDQPITAAANLVAYRCKENPSPITPVSIPCLKSPL